MLDKYFFILMINLLSVCLGFFFCVDFKLLICSIIMLLWVLFFSKVDFSLLLYNIWFVVLVSWLRKVWLWIKVLKWLCFWWVFCNFLIKWFKVLFVVKGYFCGFFLVCCFICLVRIICFCFFSNFDFSSCFFNYFRLWIKKNMISSIVKVVDYMVCSE